jgi:type IV secretory pathway VirB3-like protein
VVLGVVTGIAILKTIGVLLLVIGVILWILGAMGRAVDPHWVRLLTAMTATPLRSHSAG